MAIPSSPKLTKMQRFVPGLYNPTSNPIVRGQLYSFAGEDDLLVSAITAAKNELFVETADLQYLDALGSNVGVYRPSGFNLSDDQYRNLIPTLSFYPKQVRPTVIAVLDVFFGVGNPLVQVYEMSPNTITIQIPSSVPALRRTLKGAIHLKAYTVVVNSVDNVGKTMNVTVYGNGTKNLTADELAGCQLGQNIYTADIVGNAAGYNAIEFQFSAGDDLSTFQTGKNALIMNPNYPGAYISDPTQSYSITKSRGVLGQNIVAGNIAPTLVMTDSSGVLDQEGYLCFNYGFDTQEGPIRYFSRPNNHTLKLDPSYTFTKNHSIGENVNVVAVPYQGTNIDGSDYRPYLVGVTAARVLAQSIVEQVLAAGIVVNWVVVEPKC